MSEYGMTLVVCGKDADAERVQRAIEWAVTKKEVVRIACTGGMEKHVRPEANRLGVAYKAYPAEHRRYGPPGSIVRNVHMLEDANPDMVMGFTDTLDDNTVDILRRAAKSGIPTYLISTTITAPKST